MTQSLRTIMPLVVGLAALECRGAPARATYHPVHREITITTLPLLTKEMAKIYPFLTREFAHGGLLDGKEIYAFEPSTVTVVEGDDRLPVHQPGRRPALVRAGTGPVGDAPRPQGHLRSLRRAPGRHLPIHLQHPGPPSFHVGAAGGPEPGGRRDGGGAGAWSALSPLQRPSGLRPRGCGRWLPCSSDSARSRSADRPPTSP